MNSRFPLRKQAEEYSFYVTAYNAHFAISPFTALHNKIRQTKHQPVSRS